MKPTFNICGAQIIDEIFIKFNLDDGRTVTLTCQNSADTTKIGAAIVHGITISDAPDTTTKDYQPT